MDKRCNNK